MGSGIDDDEDGISVAEHAEFPDATMTRIEGVEADSSSQGPSSSTFFRYNAVSRDSIRTVPVDWTTRQTGQVHQAPSVLGASGAAVPCSRWPWHLIAQQACTLMVLPAHVRASIC